MIDQNFEIGQLVVDSTQLHVSARRTPFDCQQPVNSG
jgi:hypothetical protein